jgi:GDP-L-fucose synthase
MDRQAGPRKVYVAGHRGLVGSALLRRLAEVGVKAPVVRTSAELDLRDQAAVHRFFAAEKPEEVYLAAARVGGIAANAARQAEFLYDNLMIAANVIHAAAESGTRRLLFLGSSCIYPRTCPQPIKEEYLLSGPLEGTNEGYALAKIAGLKLCEMYRRQFGKSFISAMPTNLYGPNDDFHPTESHVIPGMMRRFHAAKVAGAPSVSVWGTGQARREFLHVDDLASALVALMDRYDEAPPINVGTGVDITIAELATHMADVVGFKGKIEYDRSKPDGTPRKVLDTSRLTALGWQPRVTFKEGLRETYEWAVANKVFG